MRRYAFWAVLTPGKLEWLERRTRSIVMTEWDEEDGKEPPFEVIPGNGLYHAIVGFDSGDVGAEMQLAEELSLQYNEPIYSIERANDPWTVMSFQNGALEVLERDPETLAKSLGCLLPGSEGSPESSTRKPLQTVVLVEGLGAQEVHRWLEEVAGKPLDPGYYNLEETPRGTLLASGKARLVFAYIKMSERLPHVTMVVVTASPSLDRFFAAILRGGEGIEELTYPPREFPIMPTVSEIRGESSPDRILAALGIPVEWFSKD